MNNKQRLEFLLSLQKKERRRRIALGVIVFIFFGSLLIFAQINNINSSISP